MIVISNTYSSLRSLRRGAARRNHVVLDVNETNGSLTYSYDDEQPPANDVAIDVANDANDEQHNEHVNAFNAQAIVAIVANVATKVTKKDRVRALIMQGRASISDIATSLNVSMQAARSLIGDIQREGDKLIVERVEGVRAGFYRYASNDDANDVTA